MELKDLNDAMLEHLNEIRGLPMSVNDVAVRFVIYAALLQQHFEFNKEALMDLTEIARKCSIQTQAITSKTGN